MPRFRYQAMGPGGDLLQGEMEAASQEAVFQRLHALGHTPIDARAVAGWGEWVLPFRGSGASIDLARFSRDLSALLKAGVVLDRALEMLAELAEDQAAAALLGRLVADLRGGASLAEALEAHPQAFGRFYVNMVRAGEAGGSLEAVLARLAEFLSQRRAMKAGIITALIYPGILVAITLVSLLVLMGFVVPQFRTLFAEMGRTLPLSTRIVIGIAEAVQAWGWILVVLLLALAFLLRLQLRRPAFRYRWDKWLLTLPLLGSLLLKVELAIFARTLGTLLAGGVPLLGALAIVKDTLSNRVLAEAVSMVAEQVKAGQSLAQAVAANGRFPALAARLLRVGEESGRLEPVLVQLAETYDEDVRVAIQRLLSVLEPALIIGLGVMIGGIIMSILVAILSVTDLAF